jgi:S-adenosylmethionine:tRNA ribosyltransferase-isomerase
MKLDDFNYHLPPDLIAQEPLGCRDESRLMTLDRSCGQIDETRFRRISDLLHPGDLLVINDTRVIPARLQGRKGSGGKTEVFLVRRVPGDRETWQCLLRSSKAPRPGTVIAFAEGVSATVEDRASGECWLVSFSPADRFAEWLELHGTVPLPPYIRRHADESDRERYQTVFARNRGAVAAPTAGLHMTPELLDEIRAKGVEVAPLTLHVGLGTFMPIRCDDLSEHRMHCEQYFIPSETAELIRTTRHRGGRVVALGTTTIRALEHAAEDGGSVAEGEGEADIFIRPGFRFKVADALITNFHLPKSTLLMLVAAFAGEDLLFRAYARAVERRFRFFSYGDAMFIH